METEEKRDERSSTEERESILQSQDANSRRRALILGLAAAPAVLTLMRRPVWAQTRTASPGICASLMVANSLNLADEQLAAKCEAPTTTQTP